MKILINIFISILLFTILIFSFTNCAKCIKVEYVDVEVKIKDSYHRSMWIQPVRVGKVTTYITHPARYEITVIYNDIEFTVSGSETYNKYKDMMGQSTMGQLEISTYDDGTVKYNIISLK